MLKKLVKLALPIMGTSFIQMAYNMIDMMWIGRVGSDAVAAVGTAGFFTWFAWALVLLSKIGGEVKIAQSVGEGNIAKIKSFAVSSLQLNIVVAILYGAFIIILHKPLIGFFTMTDANIIRMAETYLIVMGVGMIVMFINPMLTSIFTGLGDSKTPFIMNTIGLILNIVLDPILIFGLVGFPELGVLGAAIATVLAQVVVTVCFIIALAKRKEEYLKLNLLTKPCWEDMKILTKISLPIAIQNAFFSMIGIVLGRFVASWGPIPIAVQKVGTQIESISWMTAGGISTALSTFVGQNYGAQKYDRIEKGLQITILLATFVGILATVLLMGFGEEIFAMFIPEEESISQGANYLYILGYSQILMCIEITIAGLFNGLGKTYIPSVVQIVITISRIPLAYWASKPQYLGIDGIWWIITLTAALKGIIMVGLYIYLKRQGKLYAY
ncbi:MATE family efflux transporter [Candidatus Epulonipiscium fishelsonii]|uniref:MATE family efflux transporter n=1 Tax=Candidatus Epulonipiscium fishelsonii TaxID=77094 RepID=A0ACC8XCZ5_9FIRM|nr:MATE family efflux transporter [Epulopiscium sp. SCG-B11WGA-EpuloA1]ONI41794.1 MATE family efflux transporter [Epulopiscium sp. SCG-B05WGA-EpuloA1]